MSQPTYLVTANRLNLRSGPGVEAPVLAILSQGDALEYLADSAVTGWWQVRWQNGSSEGYVARQYLSPVSGGRAALPEGVNSLLWSLTTAAAGHVRYELGAKHSADGAIDCSGWVGEITLQAFDLVNAAASPEIVFHKSDYHLLDTHSDGIVTGIEARTGWILHGADVIAANLRPGMLIGCNFGNYKWELSTPPRVYGIDHIVAVVRDPTTNALFISQSSHSGGGVNLVALDDWLSQWRAKVAAGCVHAVDPFALADGATAYMQAPQAAAPAPQPNASVSTDPSRRAFFTGRGAYVLSAAQLLDSYGDAQKATDELVRCKCDYILVRIHGRGYAGEAKNADPEDLKSLIRAARSAGLRVGGWGWCQGEDPAADAALAWQTLKDFGVDGYMADIEQGVNGSNWTRQDVTIFATKLRSVYSGPFGITSHGFIDWHDPGIFSGIALAGVDCVNPQAYWAPAFPTQKMLQAVGASAEAYPPASPASYVRLCADRWRRYDLPITVAISVTPEEEVTRPETDAGLSSFLGEYAPPAGVMGCLLWHFGGASKAACNLLAAN